MTKLTTERLEKFVNDIKTDGMCDITDHQVALALRQLLAYELAAKNPLAWVATDSEGFPEYNSHNEFSADCGAGTPLYAAPVLPKQPELVEKLKKVMNSWLAMEPKLAFQPEFTDVMMLLDAEPAPAQPVIPEGLLQAINRLLDNDGSRGRFSAMESYDARKDLELLLASAAQQNEPQNIPENIPAQPISELREIAIALYKPPFKFDCGYIWDAGGQMVADNNLDKDEQILRVRGWGRISYLENAEALQDEVGEVIAIALSDYWNRNIEAAPAQESE